MSKLKRSRFGFSLIELVIVIAILAVLAAVLAPALIHYVEDSRASSDTHSMDEVVNAVQLGLTNPDAYDEMAGISVGGNVSCYIDSSSESGRNKQITKQETDGTAQYTFGDDERLLDETPYTAAGSMKGVTITFVPNANDNNSTYDLKNAVVNKYAGGSGRLEDYPALYNAVRQTVGDKVSLDSQTYGNSEFTIFIRIGSTGGNQASAQDAIQVYGQYNGTNLPKTYPETGVTNDRDATFTPPAQTPTNTPTVVPGSSNTPTNDPSNGGSGTVVNPTCQHTNTTKEPDVEATCQKPGSNGATVCDDCGHVLQESSAVSQKQHSFSAWTSAGATSHERVCAYGCGTTESGEHTYGSEFEVIEPTCTEQGQIIKSCTVCGYKTTQFEPEYGHNWSAWSKKSNEQCKRTCSVCQTEETKAHTFVETGREKGSLCTDPTNIQFTCSVCQFVFVQQTSSNYTEHKFETYTADDSSTHTAKCSNGTCSATDTKAHIFVITSKNDATCTTNGMIGYKCSTCGKVALTTTPATGHKDTDDNNKCDNCGKTISNVSGLGQVETNDPNTEFTYNANEGTVSGITPPEDQTAETPPEIPSNKLPTTIEFTFGRFDSITTSEPGEYATVPYTTTYVTVKNPKQYISINYCYWLVDQNENVIQGLTPTLESFNYDEYSTWIVYNANSGNQRTLNGKTADSLMIYSFLMSSDDSEENAIYLAAFLNQAEGTKNYHVAKWNGTGYTAQNKDNAINAIKEFTQTTTITTQKTVQIKAPSTSTTYSYVPIGVMKAEQGMTWRQWLASDYNTTGETNPTIKTADFVDVSYDDVIVAGQSYGFFVAANISVRFDDGMNEPVFISAPADSTWQELINSGRLSSITMYSPIGSEKIYNLSIQNGYVVFDSMGGPSLDESIQPVLATDKFGDYDEYYLVVKRNTNGIRYLYGKNTKDIITFTINGTQYQAEAGMTWDQWVDSKYNDGTFYKIGLGTGYTLLHRETNTYDTVLSNPNRMYIYTTETITSGTNYLLLVNSGATD